MLKNPVIEKELKTKMRGWKSPIFITAYLAFLGLVIYLYFLSTGQLSKYSMEYFNPRIAVNSYYFLASFQFGLLLFIVPVLTCGAISGERERQTLDLLLCTNFPTLSIITGKLVVSVAHILLLTIASLPIMGSVFLFGGIKIEDLLLLALFYTITTLMVGSLGIFYSTVFKKTIVSIIVTYITLGFLAFGTLIAMFVWAAVSRIQTVPETWQVYSFLFSNPLFGFASVISGEGGGYDLISIFGIGYRGMNPKISWIKPWMVNMTFDIIISAILIIVSAWRIKPVKTVKKGLVKPVREKEISKLEVRSEK